MRVTTKGASKFQWFDIKACHSVFRVNKKKQEKYLIVIHEDQELSILAVEKAKAKYFSGTIFQLHHFVRNSIPSVENLFSIPPWAMDGRYLPRSGSVVDGDDHGDRNDVYIQC